MGTALPVQVNNESKAASQSKSTRMRKKQNAPNELLEASATISAVCDELGVCRGIVWHWIEADEQLRQNRRLNMAGRADRKATGCEMLLAGAGTREVAETVGVNENTVVNWRLDLGLPVRGGKRGTPEIKAQSIAMREGGDELGHIASELGVSLATASR